MKIQNLKIECDAAGGTCVEIWARCSTQEDIDDITAWLRLAKNVMAGWGKINAKASRPAKAAAGKNENTEPGKVQGQPQQSGGADGKHPIQA